MPPKKAASKPNNMSSKKASTLTSVTNVSTTSGTLNESNKKRKTDPTQEISQLQDEAKRFVDLDSLPSKRQRKAPQRYQDENYVSLMLRDDDSSEKELFEKGEDYDSNASTTSEEIDEELSVSDNSFIPGENDVEDISDVSEETEEVTEDVTEDVTEESEITEIEDEEDEEDDQEDDD